MVCKDVGNYTTEYGKIALEIKRICTNRVCTLDTIQKTLEDKGIKVDVSALLAMISQIDEMMTFDKKDTYETGDIIIYQKGRIFKSDIIANLLVKVSYKRFYLYNIEGYKDCAFKEHINSKLEFEVNEKNTIKCTSDLDCALIYLNILTEKWKNYVFVSDFDDKVYCMKKDNENTTSKVYLGKFVRKRNEKERNDDI